jgi:hypothetical protein
MINTILYAKYLATLTKIMSLAAQSLVASKISTQRVLLTTTTKLIISFMHNGTRIQLPIRMDIRKTHVLMHLLMLQIHSQTCRYW